VHILELRLDYLHSAAERSALFRWLARQRRLPTLIATCRTRQGGGKFGGSAWVELQILAQAARAGCRWCDVELESAEQVRPEDLRRAMAPARLLVSAHDFRRLPLSLPRLARRLAHCGGQAIKIAATCHSLSDDRRLLALARGRRNVVVIPMGEKTLGARILALREGSALAYAAIANSTAPGQLSLDSMINVYHLDRRFGKSTGGPTRRTRVYGVIGNPVAHSLSPLMHNAAFAERRLNAVYLPFDVLDLADFIGNIGALRIAGFSVTIPHKQRILRYLDGCDPLAAEIGAVNTVVLRGTRLYGYNTDYVGVLRAIESRVPLRSSRVLLIGAGGVARAAAFALSRAGAAVAIWARRPEQARALARAAEGQALERPALQHEFFDAVVNCTPVGLRPGDGSPLRAGELNCSVVMDLIYRPRTTPLLRLAARRGIATISGVEMFLTQGMAQYEIWTGERAPEAVMRKAVLAALKQEEQREEKDKAPARQ